MQVIEEKPILPANDVGSLARALLGFFMRLAFRVNRVLPKDGTEPMSAPLTLATYTTGTLPTASSYTGAIIYVSDGSAGQKFRGSDGSAWVNLG